MPRIQCAAVREPMRVVTVKHLSRAAWKYPDAATEIAAWRMIVKAARWRHFVEVQQTFKDADAVGRYAIFNIRRNRYRLVTIIHYSRERDGRLTDGHVYVRRSGRGLAFPPGAKRPFATRYRAGVGQ